MSLLTIIQCKEKPQAKQEKQQQQKKQALESRWRPTH